jgi:hypothetical protein
LCVRRALEQITVTVPGAGQEPIPHAGQEPGGSTPPPSSQTPPAAGQEPAPERYDAEYVKELRKSEAATRKKLQEAEARIKAADDEKLSEAERLQKRADEAEKRATEAEARARQALVRSAVMVELGKQGAVNPARIYALVDQSAVELDDDGNVSGADKAVEKLLKDEPYLKGADDTRKPAERGTPPTPKPNGTNPTREQDVDKRAEVLRSTGAYPRF